MKFAAIAALALTVGFGAVTPASAVTFTLTGGTPYTLPHNFNPNPGAPGLSKGDTVHQNATLGLSAPGRVTVTYGGAEAGYTNSFLLDGVKLFDNKTGGAPVGPVNLGAGTVPFAFSTKNPSGSFANGASQGVYGSLAFFKLSDTSVYALFNDSSKSDMDYDDMWVKMDVAPVPLPAATWLLLGGIGGLGAASRKRWAAL